MQAHALAEAVAAHIRLLHRSAEVLQRRGDQCCAQQKAHRDRGMEESLLGRYFRNHQGGKLNLRPREKYRKRHGGRHQPEGFRRAPEHLPEAPDGIAPCGTIGLLFICFFQRKSLLSRLWPQDNTAAWQKGNSCTNCIQRYTNCNYGTAGTRNSDVKAPSSLLYFTQPPCCRTMASARCRPNPWAPDFPVLNREPIFACFFPALLSR